MTTSRLPAALAPWATALSAISPELAVALGPLLRRLDALVGEREPVADVHGDPDGLGGLSRSGRPDQLLPSEWLLADEYPEEFLRRLVDGELLHLAPEFNKPTVRGRMVALVDAGPTQAGAGRLVQLAALLVLHRRAAARGTELVVGVLGDAPGRTLTGDLAELLPAWLATRRTDEPTPSDVELALAELDAADQAWLLTSPRLAERIPPRPGVLTSEPARWSADGASHVTIRLDGTTAELPLPASRIAVRALRGAEFRRGGPVAVTPPADNAGKAGHPTLPVFNTEARTLLARGGQPTTLFSVNLPNHDRHAATALRMHRHDLPGPVLAAGRTGRRLIVLCVEGDQLITHVIGRQLPDPGGYSAQLAAFGVEPALLAEVLAGPVLPLLRRSADLELPLAGRWWRIRPDGRVADYGAVGPGTRGRTPFNRLREPRLFDGWLHDEARGVHHFLHSNDTQAWSHDSRTWEVRTAHGAPHEAPRGSAFRIAFSEQAEVIGLVGSGLITLSRAGHLVRNVTADGVRTLTRFSGGPGTPTVHPSRPLIAAETRPGRIVVGDPTTGRIHFLIGGTE
ncbi:hypothetical protein [Kitasatospora sp. Root187]|uniref:hypothetical protein n=2 Tax=unclassified Kitasatospora TaxID=2633591 RepID=UPI0012F9B718|nr:hypothetical protein [Kitasatospora sp. Root187]